MTKKETGVKVIPLEERLKTIKNYHIMGSHRNLSKSFVEKAIDDALAVIGSKQ